MIAGVPTDPGVAAILGPSGVMARTVPGWESRPQQLAMASAVARAIEDRRPLLVEAGTGTGKTLAYLVPALLSGRRVIVSTGTKALQEQLLRKDVPLLRAHLDRPVEAAVLKGISNYLCLRRLSELGDTSDPDLVTITSWARATKSGDRADVAVPEESPAWRVVTTTPDARLGPRCPFFERCFVTQARRAAAQASIVIVNHHLFFADLSLRAHYPGAQVLPDYDAVIFDEAHQIEEIATEHFGVSVSTLRLAALVRDAAKALADEDAPAIRDAETRGDTLFALVRGRIPAGPEGGRISQPPDLFTGGARDAWFRLDAALEVVASRALRRAGEREGDAGEDAAAVHRRAEAFRADLATVAERAGHKHVHWLETRGRAVFLHASPVDVAPLLRETLYTQIGSVVLTSATLTADGRFDYVRDRLGLGEDAADELSVGSPFDYVKQSLLYLPRDLPLPDDPGFLDAAIDRIAALLEITTGRAFVLFTSWRSLRAAAAALRERVTFPLIVQGDAPRHTLVEKFRTTAFSVLLATSSFWEGIDVPGHALSLVVLEKLPFAAPDDPLTAARVSRLEEEGADPFARYQVPRAALTLKQGFGRLIRRRDDRGIVAILDGRILARAYGRAFLATLPPAGRTSSLEQVRRWW